jgi:hypothetical protein
MQQVAWSKLDTLQPTWSLLQRDFGYIYNHLSQIPLLHNIVFVSLLLSSLMSTMIFFLHMKRILSMGSFFLNVWFFHSSEGAIFLRLCSVDVHFIIVLILCLCFFFFLAWWLHRWKCWNCWQ